MSDPMDLPEELFCLVLSHLLDFYDNEEYRRKGWSVTDTRQLYNAVLVNKAWQGRFTPLLYAIFEDVSRPKVWLFLRTIIQNEDLARLVTDLRILKDPNEQLRADTDPCWKRCEQTIVHAGRRIGLPKKEVGLLRYLGRTRPCTKILLAFVPKLKTLNITLPYGNDFLDFALKPRANGDGMENATFQPELKHVSVHCRFDAWGFDNWILSHRSLTSIFQLPSARKLTLFTGSRIKIDDLIKADVTCSTKASAITDLAVSSSAQSLSMDGLRNLLQIPSNLTSLTLHLGREIWSNAKPDHVTNYHIWDLLSQAYPNLRFLDYHTLCMARDDYSMMGSLRGFTNLKCLRMQPQILGWTSRGTNYKPKTAEETLSAGLQSFTLYAHFGSCLLGYSRTLLEEILPQIRGLIEDRITFPKFECFILQHETGGLSFKTVNDTYARICRDSNVIYYAAGGDTFARSLNASEPPIEDVARSLVPCKDRY